jgi:hypothetical protein
MKGGKPAVFGVRRHQKLSQFMSKKNIHLVDTPSHGVTVDAPHHADAPYHVDASVWAECHSFEDRHQLLRGLPTDAAWLGPLVPGAQPARLAPTFL